MSWIKPYLRLIRRVQAPARMQNSAQLVGAFEGSLIEVEFVASQKRPSYGPYNAVGICHFQYITKPAMAYQQEGFQRGPKHEGKAIITIRAYVWTDDQIKGYVEMKKKEEFELISTIDASLKEAMDAYQKKCAIYIAGCRKREKYQEINEIQIRMERIINTAQNR